MTCVICKFGDTSSGHATVTLERDGTTVIVKDVPADICEDCGEILTTAEQVVSARAEVQILRFAA